MTSGMVDAYGSFLRSMCEMSDKYEKWVSDQPSTAAALAMLVVVCLDRFRFFDLARSLGVPCTYRLVSWAGGVRTRLKYALMTERQRQEHVARSSGLVAIGSLGAMTAMVALGGFRK